MNGHNAIVIVVDRLGAGALGPYGNTWIETPAFNRLASQSLLWENALSTAPTLAGGYEAIASGPHPLVSESGRMPRLWDLIQRAGTHTALLTDDPQIREWSTADSFAERVVVAASPVTEAAESLEQTQIGQLFLAAVDWISTAPSGFCLLLHSQGMSSAWDAPREFREQCADEDDPQVPDFVEPPRRSLGPDADPDEVLGVSQAYAGQVVVLDHCLDTLLDFLAERGLLETTLVIVTAPRGFPLGERNGRLGECGDQLHEELIHIPMLIRRPDQRHAMVRCQTLIELTDLHATLAAWFQCAISPSGPMAIPLLEPSLPGTSLPREYVISVLGDEQSIRTPAWFLRRSPATALGAGLPTSPTSGPAPATILELYAKPDDRWEVNEVADRCGETAEELASVLDEFVRRLRAGEMHALPRLPEHLLRRND